MYCTTANLSKISAKAALNDAIRRLQAMCLLSPELDEEHSDIITIVDDSREILRQTWTICTNHMVRLTACYDPHICMYVCTITHQSHP